MLLWFLQDSRRLDRERRAVEDLAGSVRWLVGHEWLIDGDGLSIAATIRIGQRDFRVRLSYPTAFPYTLPTVRPVGEDTRLSAHQYGGADGALCLEWGPDNWHPDVTAAELLTSTHDLLGAERTENDPDTVVLDAPSRHSLTQGQELRSANVRWVLGRELQSQLSAFPRGAGGEFTCSLSRSADSWVCVIHAVRGPGETEWSDIAVPQEIPGTGERTGKWLTTDLAGSAIRTVPTLEAFQGLVGGMVEPADVQALLIIDAEFDLHLALVLPDGDLIFCRAVTSTPDLGNARTPQSVLLKGSRIAVVGLGSVGSKMAISLARMGAADLYLVDHDILLPENLSRHALDWQGVDFHKVDAAARAIGLINPEATVEVERIHLTGQESSAYLNTVIQRLCRCQVVVDATGDPAVFNLLSGVCGSAGLTMVWLEVFGGGIGGLFGRSRPGIDGRPQDIRSAYLGFCDAHPVPPELARARDYTVESADSPPLTASDADVAVVAHFAARMTVDALLPEAPTDFAESLYLVGLSPQWVFDEAPTILPLYTRTLPKGEVRTEVDKEMSPETTDFLLSLLKKAEEK